MTSSSCVVNSDSEVVATFDTGVPTSTDAVAPDLKFFATEGTHYGYTADSTVANPLSVTSTSSGVVTSF